MSVTTDAFAQDLDRPPLLQRLSWRDWLWAALVAAATTATLVLYHPLMDPYDRGILIGSGIGLVALGLGWSPVQRYSVVVGALALAAVWLYGGDLARGETQFLLEYFLSSQAAIMWMSLLFVMSTVVYFVHLASRAHRAGVMATGLAWTGAVAGLVGMLVRWRESYLIGPDVGYIPVSNLYEVFVLFCVLTTLLYLYYETRVHTRMLGGFVMLVVSAAVGFLLWYTFDRGAHEIQPLVPALDSYWMKIHVPANFVGYGCFALAAMVGTAYLLRDGAVRRRPRGLLATALPDGELLDELMYKSIALGFAFFTVATILGALWAAEAWGGYWSWDPKETWALIVWLNYAAWLHMRITKGWSGRPMAWWAIVGLFVTLFAFLGVNMFLSGLHSYGGL